MRPSENKFHHIAHLMERLICVRECYFEPYDSSDTYCGNCIITNEKLSFEDVEFVQIHRVMINRTGLRAKKCIDCRKSLTYHGSPYVHNCPNCRTSFLEFLLTSSSARFDHIVTSPQSIIHTISHIRRDGDVSL